MADENKKFTTRIKKKPMPKTKTPPKKEEVKQEEGVTKRLTIDLPHNAYIAMKMHVLKRGITAKGYIKDLIMKDLEL